MKIFVVAIFGPTGVGKTALSLYLAENYGEIISVDSRQVYKYMNIGTAKPSYEDRSRVKHHLIDIINPDVVFTAAEFKLQAENLIPQIIDRKKIPFLVGGTGLYFNSLINGMADIPKISHVTSNFIKEKWNNKGQDRMYSILSKIDPEYASKIHPNDKQRTMRSLEVFFETKNKFSNYLISGNVKKEFNYIKIGINIEREKLYNQINIRVDKMIESGLIDEVKKLLEMGYDEKCPGMNGIGYKEILLFLREKITLDNAIYEIKKKSRHYAKRQITWFKHLTDVKWFTNDEFDNIKKYIFNFLGKS